MDGLSASKNASASSRRMRQRFVPDSLCSDYMSTVIDRRYVRGAPRKNVPNEATLDQ